MPNSKKQPSKKAYRKRWNAAHPEGRKAWSKARRLKRLANKKRVHK